ncbi:MAG: chemotaxis protein CheB, partial [Myxococcales bacterium]|nr:chemotaxis protein CheB [Myxococcales bacterium]
GPDAVTTVLRELPRPLGIPILVVQHMPAFFTPMFAQRLGSACGLPVCEVVEGAVLEPRTIVVAPSDHHTLIERGPGKRLRLRLERSPPVNFCRPSADVLFGSAARVLGGNVLAVVLTGLGQDGKVGAGQIIHAGGTVLAQDEASSVVWGMPGAVVRAGFATRVVPLDQMAAAISQRVARVGAAC